MKNLRFSVVIPLFNKQDSIARAVKSVLGQTYKDFELIVVDDGSTDNSLAVLNGNTDYRLNIISQENQGVSAARNRGVAESDSGYICFLDADDEWHPEFLYEISILLQEEPDCALYITACHEINEKGLVKPGLLSSAPESKGLIDNFYHLFREYPLLINSSNVCVNRDYFLKAGGFPEGIRYGEDIYLWLILADMGNVSVSHRKLSTIYRDAENRAGDSIDNEIGYHVKYFLGEGIHSIKEKHQKDLIKFVLKSAVFHALYATLAGKRSLARMYAECIYKKNRILGAFVWIMSFSPRYILSMAKTIKNS